jgi:uncharacterized protein (TIGR03435 family)
MAGLLAMPALVLCGGPYATQTRAQSPGQNAPGQNAELPDSVFEVVSIKQNKNASGMSSIGLRGERFLATGMTLHELIQESFAVEEDQLSGEPRWLKSESYDIEAKIDHSVAEHLHQLSSDQRVVECDRMLRTLLADRFKLAFRWETKKLPVYALIVVRKGPQIKKAKPGDTYPDGIKDLNGRGHGDVMSMRRGSLVGQGISIASLVEMLSQQQLGRLVIDKTGLTGKYDFTLQWTPNTNQRPRLKALDDGQLPAGSAPPTENSGPSLFTAIQEQLGLKLQPEKDPVPLLVIDHIERPTEN